MLESLSPRKKLVLGALGASLCLSAMSLAGAKGLRRLERLRADIERQEQKNRELREENARLARTVRELSPPLQDWALEKAAREQRAPPRPPLMDRVAAAYVLALRLRSAIPLLAALVALDAGLTVPWPQIAAHASFAVLFAALYHALLGARLAAARRAEGLAVRKRVADAEARARELRLVAVSSDGPDAAERHLLAGVAEVEEVLRGALAVAEAALRPHTVAVFLLSPDGESVRLRECASVSERLFRGPLSSREG